MRIEWEQRGKHHILKTENGFVKIQIRLERGHLRPVINGSSHHKTYNELDLDYAKKDAISIALDLIRSATNNLTEAYYIIDTKINKMEEYYNGG